MEKKTQSCEKININEKYPDYPSGSMWDSFAAAAEKYPENIALSFMGRDITYRELVKKVGRLAKGFASLGLKKGDVVMLCLPNIPEAVLSLYALNSIGAVACLVHPLSSSAEIYDYYKKSGASSVVLPNFLWEKCLQAFENRDKPLMIIASGELELSYVKRTGLKLRQRRINKAITYGERVIRFSDLLNKESNIEKVSKSRASDTAVILFSGGTTGEAKAVPLSNFNLNATAENIRSVSGYDIAGKGLLAAMPIFHGFGLGVGIHTALCFGASSVLIPRFENKLIARTIVSKKPEFLSGVPTLFEALRTNPYFRKADLSFLLGAFCGGDVLRSELRESFEKFLKSHNSQIDVREGYGCTECVSAATLSPLSKAKAGSVGLPLPLMKIKITDKDQKEVKPFETGEICISGPTVMTGYMQSFQEEALRLHDDGKLWLHTGDLGFKDDEGYLYFSGRIKRLIVTSGYNVYPHKLEELICSHPLVSQCCVVGVKDAYKMERLKAFVVLSCEEDDEQEVTKNLIEFQKERVAKYSVVKEIEFRKSLPLTKLGKVDYRALSEEANRAIPVS